MTVISCLSIHQSLRTVSNLRWRVIQHYNSQCIKWISKTVSRWLQ